MNRDLLERAAERARIDGALADATRGAGRLVLVEGPAGIGKSVLLADTVRRAASGGLRVLRARAGELERDFAFGLVRQLLEAELSPTPPGGDEFAVLAAQHRRLLELAAQRPVLLALDDLHWADAPSLRFVDYATRRLDDVPVAIVATLRPVEPGAPAELLDRLRGQAGVLRMSLQPLSAKASAQLVRRRLPRADRATCAAYHEASAGNPFYLEELLRGGAPETVAAVRAARIAGLAESLGRRIARIDDAPKLAAAMAVLGDGCELRDAARLAGLPLDAAGRAAAELRRIEVLSSEAPVVFSHPVVRRSLYDALSVQERASAHRAAADVLEGRHDAVAAQLLAVPPAASNVVAARLLDAARDAVARGAHGVAAARLERALAEEAAKPDRVTLLSELGAAQMILRRPEAAETLALAHAEAGPDRGPRIAALLAELLGQAGRWEECVAIAAAGRAAVDGSDPALADELDALQAVISAYDPALVGGLDADRPRLDEVARGTTWGARALALLLLSIDALRGAPPGEIRARFEGIPHDDLLLSRRAGGWAASYLIWPLLAIDELDLAQAEVDALASAGERTGALLAMIGAAGFSAIVAVRRGDLAAAEDRLRAAVELALESGATMGATTYGALAGDALLERPGLADLAAAITSLELPAAFAATTSGAMLLEVRGRLARERGDRASAARDLRAAGTVYEPLRFGPAWSPWRSELALALLPDARDEARRLCELELTAARTIQLPRAEAVALRALGLTATGDEAVRLLRESCERLEGTAAPLELARSRVELGAALRRANQRRDAREELAAGLDLAHRCGALRLRDRAEAELRADGARPRRAAGTGVEALTASELRVARLAAAGRTNAEIAGDLYVTVKTVESHLSRAYAKLGLAGQGSRARLAAALGPAPQSGA